MMIDTYRNFKLIIPNIRIRNFMLSGKFVSVFEISILDVLGKPVFSKVKILLGYWCGHPGESLEEDIMLLLVSISITRLTAGQKLFFLIIKMVSKYVSIEV